MRGDQYRAGKRLWSAKDDALLRRLYLHTATVELATRLRRSVCAVSGRANRFGITKNPEYYARVQAGRFKRGSAHIGAAYWYPKGHVPANKGLRRPGWSRGRMQETQFKKGALNGVAATRFKPVGSTRLVDGYLYRKVSAVPGPWTRNWKPEHVLEWARVHGAVPPGHCVIFKNGDRTDMRLDNLELITRRENMRRNSVHNLPKPLASAVRLLGALNRQIHRRFHGHEEQDRRSPQSPVRDPRGAQGQGRSDGHRARESGR